MTAFATAIRCAHHPGFAQPAAELSDASTKPRAVHTVNDLRLDSIYLSLLGFVAVYRLLNVWRTHPILADQAELLPLPGFERMGQCAYDC